MTTEECRQTPQDLLGWGSCCPQQRVVPGCPQPSVLPPQICAAGESLGPSGFFPHPGHLHLKIGGFFRLLSQFFQMVSEFGLCLPVPHQLQIEKCILVPLPAWLMMIGEKIRSSLEPHGKPVNKSPHVGDGQLILALK